MAMISAVINYIKSRIYDLKFYLIMETTVIKEIGWTKWLLSDLHSKPLLSVLFLFFLFELFLTRNRVPLFTVKISDETSYTLIFNKKYTPKKQEIRYLVRLLDTSQTDITTLYKIYFHWHVILIWRFGKLCVDAWKYLWCYEAQLIAEQFNVTLDYAVKVETKFRYDLASFRRAYKILILTESALAARQPWLVLLLRLSFTFIIVMLCLWFFFTILKPLYFILKYPVFFLFVATRFCLGGWYLWLILNQGSTK